MPPSPIASCSMPARRRTPRVPAGSARPSTGRCWKSSISGCRSCCRAGSTPTMSREALRITRAAGVDVSSGVERAPGVKDPDKIRAFIRAARAAEELTVRSNQRYLPQFLPQRPRRARPFRQFRRPLRRRDADAADPRSGKGLRDGQGRSGLPGRDERLSQALCRPAVAALFRRAPDRASRRRQDLSQARGAQPHRLAQGQQCARPDHAGAPHGQEAHHRRDRRRPARRRHRDALRALRPRMRRLYGRGRCRAAGAQRLPHGDAGRQGGAGAVRHAHAEGCDERGAARLGHQCRTTRSIASAPSPGRIPIR